MIYFLYVHENGPSGTNKMARTANVQQTIGLITYSTYYHSKAHGTSQIEQLIIEEWLGGSLCQGEWP